MYSGAIRPLIEVSYEIPLKVKIVSNNFISDYTFNCLTAAADTCFYNETNLIILNVTVTKCYREVII